MAAEISLENVIKTYPGTARPAVNDISMRIPGGAVTVLIGPSGSGKTTLLKMMNRLIEPTSGTIKIGGQDISRLDQHQLRRSVGYAIQQVGLFPHWSVERNIATVPRLLGWDRSRIKARVEELLDLVGLEPGLRKRYPMQLSGGQQQRVGVARALAADPPTMLMDEPFAAVDPIVRERLQDELRRIQEKVRKTIVFVTHDLDEAFKVGDRIAILDDQGRLHQVDDCEKVLAHPADPFVEEFLGRERGLRALALITVGSIAHAPEPQVSEDASPNEARQAMDDAGTDWAVVLDGAGEVVGIVEAGDLREAERVWEIGQRARTPVPPEATLREALDILLTTGRSALPVFGPEGIAGVITIDQLKKVLQR